MTYIIFFAFEVFAFYRLSETTDSFVFQFLVLAVISCYGGGFSCMPAFLSDIFGVRQLAAIHGSILTAWGIAGIAGPVILALMKEATGSYSATLSLFSGMLALAFLISLLIHWQNETERKKWSVSAGNN
jgi:OFA family oxalate/formate antiporter-like MFS transporter